MLWILNQLICKYIKPNFWKVGKYLFQNHCMILENIKRCWFRTHTADLQADAELGICFLDSSHRRITAFCPDIVVSLTHKHLRLCKPNVICGSKCKDIKYPCLWKRARNDNLELLLQDCQLPACTRCAPFLSFAWQLTFVIHCPTLEFKVTGHMCFNTYVNNNIGLKSQSNQWPFTNNRPFYWKSLPGFWAPMR